MDKLQFRKHATTYEEVLALAASDTFAKEIVEKVVPANVKTRLVQTYNEGVDRHNAEVAQSTFKQ